MLPQTAEWVNVPVAERRFLKNSAEGRRLFTCQSRRLIKNLCRSTQINFTIPQKKEKKAKEYSLTSFQTQADSY